MMARTAGSKNTKLRIDPLLDEVMKKLPPSNTEFPAKKRVAWLGMMEMALDVVYGGYPAVDSIPDQTNPNTPHGFHLGLNGGAKPVDHAFYIDREGYARIAGGDRINAVEVDGQLFDLRGEGDLGAIIWADGSTGVLGKVLDIKPA